MNTNKKKSTWDFDEKTATVTGDTAGLYQMYRDYLEDIGFKF